MIHHQKQLIEALKQIGQTLGKRSSPAVGVAPGSALLLPHIKPLSGELTREKLIQESHASPLVLVSLREASNTKDDEVDARWTLFFIASQMGSVPSQQVCLMGASLFAEKLPDEDLGHVAQTPIHCQIESLPTDFSKPALSVFALNMALRYPSFLPRPLEPGELEAIATTTYHDDEPFMETIYESDETESR